MVATHKFRKDYDNVGLLNYLHRSSRNCIVRPGQGKQLRWSESHSKSSAKVQKPNEIIRLFTSLNIKITFVLLKWRF